MPGQGQDYWQAFAAAVQPTFQSAPSQSRRYSVSRSCIDRPSSASRACPNTLKLAAGMLPGTQNDHDPVTFGEDDQR